MTPRSPHTPRTVVPDPIDARRHRVVGWRDPRLIGGVLLVTCSVLLGSLLLARADDTTTVWGVRRTVAAGTSLSSEDLDVRRVRLSTPELRRYLAAPGSSPVGQVLQREVGEGELLPAAAVATSDITSGTQVPLAVAVADLPSSVQIGSLVDVWITAAEGERARGAAADRVATDVRVVGLSRDRDALAAESVRSVIVLVPGSLQENALGAIIGRTREGRVVLTQAQGEPRP